MDELSLQTILEAFNAPLTEEQAWALCYQCTVKLLTYKSNVRNPSNLSRLSDVEKQSGALFTLRSVLIGDDGCISSLGDEDTLTTGDEIEVIQSLGILLFQALDYGMSETEEQLLSENLAELIQRMTNANQPRASDEHDGTDEGIVDDGGFDKESLSDNDVLRQLTLDELFKICSEHAESTDESAVHYKAVCRALVAEALDLTTFLDNIRDEKQVLKLNALGAIGSSQFDHLECLQRTDWTRLWMQIMAELRNGVKLKKVQMKCNERRSIEFELTPYEIMMDDLRSRRYKLNKVPDEVKVNSTQVKKDVHAIILDFIRSRPPLHPVSSRRLSSPPLVSHDPHDELLKSIRKAQRLKPTPAKLKETSRTCLNSQSEGAETASRKIIKPDLALFASNSFEDDLDSTDFPEFVYEGKSRITAEPFTDFTPLSPKSPPKLHMPWQRTANEDSHERRHSITVCQSPVTSSPIDIFAQHDSVWSQVDKFMAADFSSTMTMKPSVECLSLTLEEVMHIRRVLTKAELECVVIQPELYNLLANKKICFSCRKARFGLFGLWSTTCKFCCRSVCSKCVSKMYIPTEHFEHIPVYTLSPGSPAERQKVETTTGSAPSSPNLVRQPPSSAIAAAADSPSSNGSNSQQHRIGRWSLQRSQTVVRAPSSGTTITGPAMNVCRDCRQMIANIVRASRQVAQHSGSSSLHSTSDEVHSTPSQHVSGTRNFHLNIKPVYRLN